MILRPLIFALAGLLFGCGDAREGSRLTTSGGRNLNFDSDPDNCGKADHSCLGGACEAGVCKRVQLAAFDDPNNQPQTLALDAARVYVGFVINNPDQRDVAPCSQFSLISSISRTNGEVRVVAPCDGTSGGGQSAEQIVVAGGHVYFQPYFDTSNLGAGNIAGHLQRVSIDGGRVQKLGYDVWPGSMVADADDLYFSQGPIVALPLRGGPARSLPIAGGSVALDDDNIYTFTPYSCGGEDPCLDEAHLDRMAKRGGAVKILADHLPRHRDSPLAVSGTNVYLALDDPNLGVTGIVRADTHDGHLTTFAHANPSTLYVDARSAYWTPAIDRDEEAKLLRKSLADGRIDTVVSTAADVACGEKTLCAGAAFAFAIDDVAVVWNDASGRIWLLAR